MLKRVLLALCLACLAAGVIFSVARVTLLTERVRRLETAQEEQSSEPFARPARTSELRLAPPDNALYEVLEVVDGDTLAIDTETGPLKVRVIGIDTPETVHPFEPIEPFGPEASERAKQLLEGKKVKIEYDPDPTHDTWGKYGRLLAYIQLPDGRDFGLVMIEEGMAKAYPKYPFSRQEKYLQAEQDAVNAKIGLWADQSRLPTTVSPR